MKVVHWNLSGQTNHRRLLEDLGQRKVNYSEAEFAGPGWHPDSCSVRLPDEAPGDPVSGGAWALAQQLIEQYEPPDPSIIRAVYAPDRPLHGRDMLLQGHFLLLHFIMGVRVIDVIDESRDDGTRAWGWTYATLEGHLERGRMTYEVVKHLDSGRVDFKAHGVSQLAPGVGPLLQLGWRLFGRKRQLRFYRHCAERVRRAVTHAVAERDQLPGPVIIDGLVHAPSDARPWISDGFAMTNEHPTEPRGSAE